FKMAEMAQPGSSEPGEYINLIQRKVQGRTFVVPKKIMSPAKLKKSEPDSSSFSSKSKNNLVILPQSNTDFQDYSSDQFSDSLNQVEEIEDTIKIEENQILRQDKVGEFLDSIKLKSAKTKESAQKTPTEKIKSEQKQKQKRKVSEPLKSLPSKEEKSGLDVGTPKQVFMLTADSDLVSPKEVTLVFGDLLRFKSSSITRAVAVTEKVVAITRNSAGEVDIRATGFGSTFVHLWSGGKRWTFNLHVISAASTRVVETHWKEADRFRFGYTADWSSYSRGTIFKNLHRQVLSFDQRLALTGPSPYGDLDASVTRSKVDDIEKVTGYTVGLTDAKIGPLEGINLRLFDFTKVFSELSFPGLTLKGVSFQTPLLDNLINYSYIWGREQQYFRSALSPTLDSQDESYIEGMRVGLFEDSPHRVYFNYARGYGEDRALFLKEKVFSLQTEHDISPLDISSEIAYDQESTAMRVNSRLRLEKLDLGLSLRNIEENFTTITSNPPNIGEIGAVSSLHWYPIRTFSLQTSLNVYRDRFLSNLSNPNALNYEWDGSFDWRLPGRSNLSSHLYYVTAPGIISPHQDFNSTITYHKSFDLDWPFLKTASYHLGYNFQKSRNSLSPTSDYRRNAVLSGIRFSILSDVSYYFNYDYSWLTEDFTGIKETPQVFETGLDIYHQFTSALSSTFRLYYRNEENAESLHSFLSGEDSLEGSLNLTYSPDEDFELFCDGRLRNVWADTDDSQSFIESDVRLGARIWWDSFFRWNPASTISGFVFQDKNSDGKKQNTEEGIEGVEIFVGPKKTITDKTGRYSVVVRAKQLSVSVNNNSIPGGYILTTASAKVLDLSRSGKYALDFGLSTQSGIYGAVFWDVNNNNLLDKEDKPVSAKLTLNSKAMSQTNDSGVYFFSGLLPGDYQLALDVSSLPVGFLPKTAFKLSVKVEEAATYKQNFPLRKK
ncbi:MAG: hypothetical protein PHV17_06035, partial [Candidatus Omnitrophica bacterium]|nr:hypothetical protein [Candidatus Omnitrophota bacterium]